MNSRILMILMVGGCATMLGAPTPERVAEILRNSCGTCHSGTEAAGNLRLDSLASIALGGESGQAVIPGKSSESPLYRRISTSDRSIRMPPASAPLAADLVDALREWIDAGAPGMTVTAKITEPVDFLKDIQPIFRKNCYACHSGPQPKSRLRLDAKGGAMKGGVGGPAIVPGKSSESRLVHRVEGSGGEQRMPLKGEPLKPEEIARIRAWIDQGANWPGSDEDVVIEKHWSYRKPERPPVPSVKTAATIRNPIDSFILARLEKEGLDFRPEASRETLIRRASLDLTGLPPSPAEIDAFLKDQSPNAYERLVDRLLASPHYGERWARPWLDLARFADTNGYEKDRRRMMWKYRDWVIQALNRDMPFDEFTIEQIAGDMLPGATVDQKIATGFHRNTMYNEEGGVDKEEAHFEVLVDRVNTTATVWLGTTLGCTQCHNHKYDPFTQKEYYQMMAFFSHTDKEAQSYGDTSVKWREPQLDLATPTQEVQRTKLKGRIQELEHRLKTPTPALAKEQADWEASVRRAQGDWTVLQPSSVTSESGSTLTSQEDGAILASGENPQRETYVIEAKSTKSSLTGLRLEAIPDPSLPRGGPGRDVYGNFILTEARLEYNDGRGWQQVAWKRILADDGRIEDKKSDQAWIVDASRDEKRLPRQLVLVPREPLKLPPGTPVRITLIQNSDFVGQGIGRFRLSMTTSADPALIVKPRAKFRPILETPVSQRSEQESKDLAEFFRSVAPSLEAARDELKERRNELDRLGIVTALVMEEEPGVERPFDFVRIRGGFASKGDKVWAGVPAALGHLPEGVPPNRLALAKWLASKDNPLTARVAVNRIWEQYFGRGIVETSEDFGSQGARPSHPELLDWLAVEFMDRGWSLKSIHRLIVTSTAYRQSSAMTPKLLEADPYNRLISRGPRFRMEAEMIRDSALEASGLLSAKIGGPSVFPPQPPGVWDIPYSDDKWEESRGEDKYRRAIYTFVRRSAMYPSMINFDATSREVCTVRRVRTNTPLAALTTLNDEAFFEMAQAMARRIVAEGGKSNRDRVIYGYRLATGRKPEPEELDRVLSWLDSEMKYFSSHNAEAAKVAGGDRSLAAWTMCSNVLLNLDEALTKE